MTIPWLISAIVFVMAIKVFGSSHGTGREFRYACAVFAIVGLVATSIGGFSPLHMLWYTPVAVLLSNLFAHRRLFILKRRLDRIEFSDVDELKRKVEAEIEQFNSEMPDDFRLG